MPLEMNTESLVPREDGDNSRNTLEIIGSLLNDMGTSFATHISTPRLDSASNPFPLSPAQFVIIDSSLADNAPPVADPSPPAGCSRTDRRGDRLKIARVALDKWRNTRWQEKYSHCEWGPHVLMPDPVFKKLVNRTKLRTVAEIKAATKWDWAEEYALEVVKVLDDADIQWRTERDDAIAVKKAKRAQISARNKIMRDERRRQEKTLEVVQRRLAAKEEITPPPNSWHNVPYHVVPHQAAVASSQLSGHYPGHYPPPLPIRAGPPPYSPPPSYSHSAPYPIPTTLMHEATSSSGLSNSGYYWSYTWVPMPVPMPVPPSISIANVANERF
ncbi:unnamed protein product [Somion occarium]|uniref:Uncharacterized protein n=1 Tax=Somion occarium TaxID=3059160 RepID=A0ABP1E2X1_9APHY